MPRRQRNDGDDKDDVKVLDDSGLTEAERRAIRRKQRDLHKQLEEQEAMEVDDARDKNNKIYKKVRYTREAVLDGENMTLIVNKAARKVDKLVQVPRYDADRLVTKLVQKCRLPSTGNGGASQFDWLTLGQAAGVCFNSIPSGVSFLNGPLMDGQPVHVRQRQQRRKVVVEEDVEEEKPEDVKGHTEKDENKLSAIEQSMKDLNKNLKRKVNERYESNKKRLLETYDGDIPKHVDKKLKKYGAEVDACKFLFNPKSFTQTVENIFHFSFLIKKASASISIRQQKGLDEDGLMAKPGPVLKTVKDNKAHPQAKQAIVAFSMKDWRNMCEAYEIENGDLPHRKVHKQAREASLSQAST